MSHLRQIVHIYTRNLKIHYFRMSAMDTDMITISRYITEQQRKSGGSGEFTQLTNGIVSGTSPYPNFTSAPFHLTLISPYLNFNSEI